METLDLINLYKSKIDKELIQYYQREINLLESGKIKWLDGYANTVCYIISCALIKVKLEKSKDVPLAIKLNKFIEINNILTEMISIYFENISMRKNIRFRIKGTDVEYKLIKEKMLKSIVLYEKNIENMSKFSLMDIYQGTNNEITNYDFVKDLFLFTTNEGQNDITIDFHDNFELYFKKVNWFNPKIIMEPQDLKYWSGHWNTFLEKIFELEKE